MRGVSGDSYARLRDAMPAATDQVGDELIGAARVLRDSVALRRAATDPASPAEAKKALLTNVFGAHLSATGDLVARAGELRWGSSADLASALERLGIIAVVQAAGDGDRVERELFTFGRTVTDNPELRDALSDPARSVADKQALVRSLLEGTAAPATVRLALETVTGARHTVTAAVDELIEITAEARDRDVATVRTATELSDANLDRLATALGRETGREVQLNVIVDPDVLGGLRITLGDYVIDGTVVTRLDEVRRQLAG